MRLHAHKNHHANSYHDVTYSSETEQALESWSRETLGTLQPNRRTTPSLKILSSPMPRIYRRIFILIAIAIAKPTCANDVLISSYASDDCPGSTTKKETHQEDQSDQPALSRDKVYPIHIEALSDKCN